MTYCMLVSVSQDHDMIVYMFGLKVYYTVYLSPKNSVIAVGRMHLSTCRLKP